MQICACAVNTATVAAGYVGTQDAAYFALQTSLGPRLQTLEMAWWLHDSVPRSKCHFDEQLASRFL